MHVSEKGEFVQGYFYDRGLLRRQGCCESTRLVKDLVWNLGTPSFEESSDEEYGEEVKAVALIV